MQWTLAHVSLLEAILEPVNQYRIVRINSKPTLRKSCLVAQQWSMRKLWHGLKIWLIKCIQALPKYLYSRTWKMCHMEILMLGRIGRLPFDILKRYVQYLFLKYLVSCNKMLLSVTRSISSPIAVSRDKIFLWVSCHLCSLLSNILPLIYEKIFTEDSHHWENTDAASITLRRTKLAAWDREHKRKPNLYRNYKLFSWSSLSSLGTDKVIPINIYAYYLTYILYII